MPSFRSQLPPWNYQCPYKNNCPHLQGASTQWVWSEYQSSYDEHCDHWKFRDLLQQQLDEALTLIAELENENESLKAKLKALHNRQFKAKHKKNHLKAAGNSGAHCPKKKKRGAPNGHPGWSRRKPDHIDKTIIVAAPDTCPHCSTKNLTPVEGFKDHLQEDIVLKPRTYVVKFKHHQAFCTKCRRPVIQSAKGELPNCHIGPVTKAAAVFMRYGLRVPYRKVQEFFDVFFNMPFVPASAMAFDRTAMCKGKPLYDDLMAKVQAAASIHADETYWRQNGDGHYVWYAGNNDLALFHIDRHRSSAVAQKILGDSFQGILNTDGYAAYNAVNASKRQSCLAHIIRKSKEIEQEILLCKPKYQDQHSLRFCRKISALFKKACQIGHKIKNGTIPPGQVDTLEARLYSLLNTICESNLAVDKAETLRKRLVDPKKEYRRLFTFLRHKEVQPTNNQAEQSLRNMVIFRKICFGTRSDDGSASHSVLPSLLVTAKRQGKHPLDFFQTLFTADTPNAQKALYRNPA